MQCNKVTKKEKFNDFANVVTPQLGRCIHGERAVVVDSQSSVSIYHENRLSNAIISIFDFYQ